MHSGDLGLGRRRAGEADASQCARRLLHALSGALGELDLCEPRLPPMQEAGRTHLAGWEGWPGTSQALVRPSHEAAPCYSVRTCGLWTRPGE